MAGKIVGITRTSLWKAWKSIRKELKKSTVRDVVDFLEYDIDPEKWIKRLLRQISQETYEPQMPRRFRIAKSNGFSRRMAMPHIPDLVLYRAIVDYLYQRNKQHEHKHVYFERQQLENVRQRAMAEAKREQEAGTRLSRALAGAVADYESGSRSRFETWLVYHQYRKRLIFKRVHEFILLTDITNFFDSSLFSCVADSLHQIAAPQGMVALLFMLLERLGPRGGLAESPHVGLPVDEFDCSRKLAHMILYPHDDRMVEVVGEDAYIRWMDDQMFGVESRPEALKAIAAVDSSLAKLHLTPNAGKTRILKVQEAKRHFHLDVNEMLDEIQEMIETGTRKDIIRRKTGECWKLAKRFEGQGEWDKILKRLYRLMGFAELRAFRRRAFRDIIEHPGLAQRIAEYIRCTGTPTEHVDFVESVWDHPELVYEDVSRILAESLLRLEPGKDDAKRIRAIASGLMARRLRFCGWRGCSEVAPLLLLRYGDHRSLRTLHKCFEKDIEKHSSETVRAAMVVFASFGGKEFAAVRKAAARLLRNHLSHMVRVIEKLRASESVPARFGARVVHRFDAVSRMDYVDMRSLLVARLLALSRATQVRHWLKSKKQELLKKALSQYDVDTLGRLWPD